MGTQVKTSYGTKLKYNQLLTFMNTLSVCLIDLNMLNFVIATHIVKYCNSYSQTNTFFYTVGTKVNNSYGIKLKYNQPLAFMNTLLVYLTELNVLNFAITRHIVKYCNSYI